MPLKRGFKTQANRMSIAARKELGLAPYARLCPWKLAKKHGVFVEDMSKLRPDDGAMLAALAPGERGTSPFSAGTVVLEGRHLIVMNDLHSRRRQASDLAHELAHILCGHTPCGLLADGTRLFPQDDEDEANELGPALLLSEPQTLRIADEGLNDAQAADRLGLTVEVVRMRMNSTGARRRIQFSRSRYQTRPA